MFPSHHSHRHHVYAYRLLSANFLHAGLLHLGLNCAALWSVGPEAEAVLGYATFLAIYLLSGLSGSLASFLFSDAVTVGASGAIFGLLGELSDILQGRSFVVWTHTRVDTAAGHCLTAILCLIAIIHTASMCLQVHWAGTC